MTHTVDIGRPNGITELEISDGLHGERYGTLLQISANLDNQLQVGGDATRQFDQNYVAETDGLIVGYVSYPGLPPGAKGVRVLVGGQPAALTVWQEISSTGAASSAFCCPAPRGFTWRVERLNGSETGAVRWMRLSRPPGVSRGNPDQGIPP